ncbi:MAG: hypothetical protein H8D26_04640 [Methanomicrobia archaeon]|nr:hypothetical protein [Methanomicrobia archaeon]
MSGEELIRRIGNSIDNFYLTVKANPDNLGFAKERLKLVVEEHVKEAMGE